MRTPKFPLIPASAYSTLCEAAAGRPQVLTFTNETDMNAGRIRYTRYIKRMQEYLRDVGHGQQYQDHVNWQDLMVRRLSQTNQIRIFIFQSEEEKEYERQMVESNKGAENT